MDPLSHFSIPFKGLKDGIHELTFEVDDSFFRHFENEVVTSGKFNVYLRLDKKPSVSILKFSLEGYCNVLCDRCLTPIQLPVNKEYQLLLKPGEPDDSNDEVLFIKADISTLSVAQVIYEYIILSVPIIKVYDCVVENPRPCDMSVLEKIKNEDQENLSTTIWESLAGLDLE